MPISDEEAAALRAEVTALTVKASLLEGEVVGRDRIIEALRADASKKPTRVLDPKAKDPFDRPYDGR